MKGIPLKALGLFTEEDVPKRLEEPRPGAEADRSRLVQALSAYLTRLGAPREALSALHALAHPEGKAILTGQQPGLLGGPAYTFYKAHTALRLRDEGKGRPVAAVFWVASHDHDVEEVRHLHLLAEERLLTLSLPLPSRPLGRISLEPYREGLKEALALFPKDERLDYALSAGTLSESFARLLLAYLGPRGLLVFDPMAEELAPLLVEGLLEELEDPLASAEAINREASRIRALGGRPTLRRKPGATNLFLETDQRRLLFYEEGVFTDGKGRYTKKELREILLSDPTRLTPAAGLRPVLQDRIFPTAALVAGPNELLYLAELSGVYALHRVPLPAFVRRLSALVIEPPVRRILEKYRLDPWAFVGREEAFQEALRPHLEEVVRFEERLKRLLEEAEALTEEAKALRPGLVRPLARFRARVLGEGERLLSKALRQRLLEDEVLSRHLHRLKLHLRPLDTPQERVYPFVMYALRHPVALERLQALPALGRHRIDLD